VTNLTTTSRKLNKEQLEILELLYKFRFTTRQLLTNYYSKTNPGMDVFRRLTVLEKHGLIAKRFEPKYKLLGKPAAYYLLSAGVKALKASYEPDKQGQLNPKLIYKDGAVSEQFVEHCLDIFGVYNRLRGQYADNLKFFTKSKLSAYDYFPKPLPDAYIRIKTTQGDKQYFLDIYSDKQPQFAHIKKIKQYIEYEDSEDWAITNTDLPAILALCESTGLQKRMQKIIAKSLNEGWCAEVIFAITDIDTFMNKDGKIWQLATEPDRLIELTKTQDN
jgi:hypothetical protein